MRHLATSVHLHVRSTGPRAAARAARHHATNGDRPYVAALLVALIMAALIISAPLRTWLEQRAIVESYSVSLAAVESENRRMTTRIAQLNDSAYLELEAREEQAMARPGEVLYVIVPPTPDVERIAPDLSVRAGVQSWFARLWAAIRPAT